MHDIVSSLEAFDVAAAPPSCSRWKESMPRTRASEPYKRYIAARKKWRSKRSWELTAEESRWIFHEVQAAAAMGDWGARALMSHFYLNGIGMQNVNRVIEPDPKKAVELMLQAAQNGQAWGYYDLGVAVEYGYADLLPDRTTAWKLYLKAAKLGSPDAQMALANAYEQARKLPEATALFECAYEQGNGQAAYELAVRSFIADHELEAMKYIQDGVAFGSDRCASLMWILFTEGDIAFGATDDQQHLLRDHGYTKDSERGKRYEAIFNALDLNKDLRFPMLAAVIPPPPAKLPEWNGIDDAIGPEPEGPPSY